MCFFFLFRIYAFTCAFVYLNYCSSSSSNKMNFSLGTKTVDTALEICRIVKSLYILIISFRICISVIGYSVGWLMTELFEPEMIMYSRIQI